MGRLSVCVGLLAFGASYIIPAGGVFLSAGGGVLVGLGAMWLARARSRKQAKQSPAISQNQINQALDEATARVLVGAKKPWTVIAHGS